MGKKYYPSNDQQYNAWLANFVMVLGVNAATVGLLSADIDPLEAAGGEFDGAYTALVTSKGATRAATGLKVTKRQQTEEILLPLVRRIQNHPGMTDQLRGLLGLTQVYLADAPLPITELMPILSLETAPGQVTVHWGPNPGNERLNGKPAGVRSANIYRKKVGDESYQLVESATSSPFVDTVSGPAADYVYVVRYRGTKPADLSKESDAHTIAARGELAA